MEDLVMDNIHENKYQLASTGEFDEITDISLTTGRWNFHYEGSFEVSSFEAGLPFKNLNKVFTIPLKEELYQYMYEKGIPEFVITSIGGLIKESFTEEELRLSIYLDPEGEMENQFQIEILTNKPPREALDLFNEFEDKYFDMISDDYLDLFLISIEYL